MLFFRYYQCPTHIPLTYPRGHLQIVSILEWPGILASPGFREFLGCKAFSANTRKFLGKPRWVVYLYMGFHLTTMRTVSGHRPLLIFHTFWELTLQSHFSNNEGWELADTCPASLHWWECSEACFMQSFRGSLPGLSPSWPKHSFVTLFIVFLRYLIFNPHQDSWFTSQINFLHAVLPSGSALGWAQIGILP